MSDNPNPQRRRPQEMLDAELWWNVERLHHPNIRVHFLFSCWDIYVDHKYKCGGRGFDYLKDTILRLKMETNLSAGMGSAIQNELT